MSFRVGALGALVWIAALDGSVGSSGSWVWAQKH